jgi:hypothetical protein
VLYYDTDALKKVNQFLLIVLGKITLLDLDYGVDLSDTPREFPQQIVIELVYYIKGIPVFAYDVIVVIS